MREGLGGVHTARVGAQVIHRCIGVFGKLLLLGDGVLAVLYGDGLRCLPLYYSLAYHIFFSDKFLYRFFS